jgi:polar amino acid transport system substrate-binding protein
MQSPPVSDPRVADIVRARVLRLALFPSFFYRRVGDELRGVGIEITRALATRTGVALKTAEHPSPPAVVAALAQSQADVALLGIDPVRGREVDFSPPVLTADFTYLVPSGSPVRTIADADKSRIRIGLVRHHAMDTALRGKLAHAEPIYADTPDAAFALFRDGKADVLAGIRPGLLMYAGLMSGTHVLADRYGRNVIALAVKKGEAALLAYIREFVMRAKADGTIAQAIETAGLQGVEIAD